VSDIASTGDFSPQGRDVLSILWAITKGCNYECSYCPYHTKLSDFSSRDNLLRAAEVIVGLGRPGYQITLYGGEPTFHPNFHDLVQFLAASEAPISLRMFTNGSRRPEFFEKMAALSRNIPFGVIFSLHLEQTKFENFKRAAEITAAAGKSVGINLMFLPSFRGRAREYYDELLEMRTRVPFFLEISLPYNVEGFMAEGCLAEDLTWRTVGRETFGAMPMPNSLSSPFYTRIKSNITLERGGVRQSLAPEESLQLLAKTQMPSYRDFYCCSGTNVFFIEEDGAVMGGVCSSSARIGNVFHDDALALVNHMKVVRCTSAACSSIENIPLPKFRNETEAEECSDVFRERARSYVGAGVADASTS
jgi:MoaA/NifB/PqqE/SkfB family radical SAM enzyme